jgi:SAM-dependent methyltransferase
MKKVYRFEENRDYWDRRWFEAGEDAGEFQDLTIYPIRYAENVLSRVPGRILEIGCGLGRVVKHYHARGREIVGIERSIVAVDRIRELSPGLDVRVGDALTLNFPDESFDIALAFGVYHNFESGLEQGLTEMARILKPGGHFVISMRPHNVEMILNEWYWRRRNSQTKQSNSRFHKLLVTNAEFKVLLIKHNLIPDTVYRARNMSILFRLPLLQSTDVKNVPESLRRAKGYRLNFLGRVIDRFLTTVFPSQFCNVLVFEGHKEAV